jgi:DNA-binding IclR family transcriptional regulator
LQRFTLSMRASRSLKTSLARANKVAKDRLYVTALARGLQILRCFSHDRPELSPQEIVRMTGLPQPTVWRLCYTLTKEGFLTCAGENNKMALGLPALALGYATLVRQALPKVARPYLEALTARHRLGTSLAVRDGLDMLYLQRTHGDFIYFNDPVGARRPFATAPTGWACFAAYDNTERKQVSAALKRQDPASWPQTAAHLDRAADDFRKHGCVLSLGVMHEQFNAVAVPIRSPQSGKVYGLSASGLAADWPKKRLLTVSAELIALATNLAVAAD